ncbi:Hypothetical protein ADU71_1367 [Pediococcus damnosus]|nr:hypothetical protein [Pediococcus damnosus]AMV60901.1 Hypothetical protein ADU69_1244 [Pediococcus damnosus]AMV65261.1 Hypothetical protein ADU71_1367 [Pediococcus damnosus]
MRIKQLVIDTVIAGVGILLLAGCSTSSSSSKKIEYLLHSKVHLFQTSLP